MLTCGIACETLTEDFRRALTLLLCCRVLRRRQVFISSHVNLDLSIHIPERLAEEQLQTTMAKVLVPPPVASSDEILSESGGMFYSRETPAHDVYVQ